MSLSVASPQKRSPRIGLIGAGYFSQFHLRGWQQCGANIVAVCDVDKARADAAASRFGAASSYSDWHALLARDDLDVVDIVLPPLNQYDVVVAALTREIPAICQKPFATSYWQAQRLAKLAQQTGVPLLVHENFRFMPWYRELKRLIDAGQLGRLHGVLFRLRPGDGQGQHAYLDRQPYFQKMQRFLVAETAIHFIDTFRYLLGEVLAVSARLRRVNPHIAGEDAAAITFEFCSGAAGLLDANRCNDHNANNTRRTMGELWIEGDRGCLRLDGDGVIYWKPHGAREVVHSYDAGSIDANDFGGGACTALQASAINAFLHHTPAENSATEYLTNLQIQEAIYQSHETGQRVLISTFEPPIDPLIPTL
jgi:D-apiose dehydrogenase